GGFAIGVALDCGFLLQGGIDLGGVPLAAGIAHGQRERGADSLAVRLDIAPLIASLTQLDREAICRTQPRGLLGFHERPLSSSGAAAWLTNASTSARVGIEGWAPGRVTH